MSTVRASHSFKSFLFWLHKDRNPTNSTNIKIMGKAFRLAQKPILKYIFTTQISWIYVLTTLLFLSPAICPVVRFDSFNGNYDTAFISSFWINQNQRMIRAFMFCFIYSEIPRAASDKRWNAIHLFASDTDVNRKKMDEEEWKSFILIKCF